MSLVPTLIYPRFDGTQTRLGPLKLVATYFGKALVWITGCFAIVTNEVPLPSFLSIIFASIEISLELLPKGHELVHRSWPCSLFTIASVHRRQILPKLHRLAVPRFKALTCPSPLQPVHQAKPCLDLLHFGHITPCHVSYAMSSSITLYEHSINP